MHDYLPWIVEKNMFFSFFAKVA